MTERELQIMKDMKDVEGQLQSQLWKRLVGDSMNSTEPFSFETIENFDDHIAKSIPNYHLLSDAVCDLASFFLRPEFKLIDIGCSTGRLLRAIPFNGEKIGIDISQNLLPRSEVSNHIKFMRADIREIKELPSSCLVLAIFTLQFLPISDRLDVVKTIYQSIEKGGAFIMAEKVSQCDGISERIFTNAYYDFKRKSFTTEEILDKEKDLRKLMSVQTSEQNQKMVEEAGFKRGEIFWKFYNFEAWLYIK